MMAEVEVFMSGKRYTEEFKIEAVRAGYRSGLSGSGSCRQAGVTGHSLYAWLKKFGPQQAKHQAHDEAQVELRRLKAELRRVTEERDILKKAATYFAKESG